MYDIILFDLDGTLTDPGEGITNSVAHALKKWGIEVADRSTLYRFIGPPLKDSFMDYCGFDDDAEGERAVVAYREYYHDIGIYENLVYDGIEELLRALKEKGKTVVLATSKPEPYAIRILVHFGLDKYFDVIAGATMDSTRVKKADVIAYAIDRIEDKLGHPLDRTTAVMVGDRRQDIEGATANGLDSIGVLFGYGDEEEHEAAGATYIAPTVANVGEILL